jgi:hypothetical protein
MANPTTNYGFVLPTSTDLVTDLPADFDVALQGVDTRLKALQPGTTLGDLAYSSATANTNTRLGIGSTGQVLTVSGGVPAWSTVSGGGQTLISTTTMNTTDITLSSFSGYNDLKVVLRNPYVSSGYSYMRMNGVSSTIYRPSQQRADNATTMTSLASALNNSINLSPSSGPTTSTDYSTVVMTFFDYNNASSYKLVQINTFWGNWGGGNSSASIEWNVFQSTSAITSVLLGGAWAGGSCLLYGVK